MEDKILTCIECPMGCSVKVIVDQNVVVSIEGNNCARGKMYVENEVFCPKRVVTSTVKTCFDKMVAVKTDAPVKKTEIFDVMQKINACFVDKKVNIGDIIIKDIVEGINLIATSQIG
jgi:CxxC motif-containing protein